MFELLITPDVATLAEAAADRVRAAAVAAIAARGRFRVALSGGSTPRALHRALVARQARPGRGVDWTRTDVFFGDERAVRPAHPDSNYGMARDTLLVPGGVPEGNVRRMAGEAPDLDAAARAYEAALTAGAAAPWLDLALLGLGPDGHTASLFPGTTALGEQRRLCVAVEVPQLATRRLTLTYPALLNARQVLFMVAGADKAEALRDVLAGQPLPAQRVIREAPAVVLLCDEAAARSLPPATRAAAGAVSPPPPSEEP